MKVYKYPLVIDDVSYVGLPVGAKILNVGSQSGSPYLWALVDENEICEAKRFRIAGTGHEISFDEIERYIGSIFLHSDEIVLHVFEMK